MSKIIAHTHSTINKYYINSTPPTPIPLLSTAVLENGGKAGVIYNQEKHIRDLKINGGIGHWGRQSQRIGGRYWVRGLYLHF